MQALDNKTDFDIIKTPYDLLRYMKNNISYGFVSKCGKKYAYDDKNWNKDWFTNCIVQSGEDVLKTGYGTCWDQVELERKWFADNGYEFETIFSWFEIDSPNNYPTHTFLAFKDKDKWYWFENAFADYRGIHEYDILDNLINDVKNKQLLFAIKSGIAKPNDDRLIKSYKYNKPKSNLGVRDYIDYVCGR